jgi:two-component system cell cycle sensor histidine kinase/response regulator CckA
MTPEVVAHIFEPFYTTKGPSLGSGLGLSTVYGIIAQASGTITVASRPGVGTTFRILFPAAATVAGHTSAPSPRATEPLPTGTILITDDEQPILRATARMLKRDGYTPLEAATGYQALDVLIANEVHLLLTDSLMPGMTGAELADRARQIRPGLPVLHMSGFTPPEDPAHQQSFIHKPFTAKQLLTKIRALLDPQPCPDPDAAQRHGW